VGKDTIVGSYGGTSTFDASSGTAVLSVEPATPRIYGSTADATAAAELESVYDGNATPPVCPSGHDVVLARDNYYSDALASQDLASYLQTGTLLTPTTQLSSVTASALRAEGIQTVYVVGGPLAISTTVVAKIEATPAYTCGGKSLSKATGKQVYLSVVRLYGETQYGTAERVAEYVGRAAEMHFQGAYLGVNVTGGNGKFNDTAGSASSRPSLGGTLKTAILATGRSWYDAESASALSYQMGVPILLTTPDALSPTAAGALADLGVQQVIVMGGQLAVTNTVIATLEADGYSVLRIAGKDYTDTAVQLAKFELTSATSGLGWQPENHAVLVARGDFYTDGLAGAVLETPTHTRTTPLLLTENPSTLGPYLTAFLELMGKTGAGITTPPKHVTRLTVLGGPEAVESSTVSQMQTDLQH
jgi:putative cell wall-binding protein